MNYNYDEQKAKQDKLDEMIAKFLKNGGKIEKIPAGMTGEQYYGSGLAPKKGRVRKSPKK